MFLRCTGRDVKDIVPGLHRCSIVGVTIADLGHIVTVKGQIVPYGEHGGLCHQIPVDFTCVRCLIINKTTGFTNGV